MVGEGDDGSHDETKVVGYGVCAVPGCGKWELEVVMSRTGGVCVNCYGVGWTLRRIEVLERGRRSATPRRREASKGSRDTARLAEHARRRAVVRLKAIFGDVYDMLYAEERAKAGLDPWPLEMAIESGPDPDGSETIKWAALYHAVDIDERAPAECPR